MTNLNINRIKSDSLSKVFPKLVEPLAGRIKFVSSNDNIANLVTKMKINNIRTMPVLETADSDSKLLGLISKVDVAKYLPPSSDLLPEKRLKQRKFDFQALYKLNQKVAREKIGQVGQFQPLFDGSIYSDSLRMGDTLQDVINRFLERGTNNRRYRTFTILDDSPTPVLDDSPKLTGVLSYLDIIQVIIDNYRDLRGFYEYTVADLTTKDVETLSMEDPFNLAAFTLEQNPFTHIPIKENPESNKVVGIIDEVVIASLSHPLIFDDVFEMPVKDVMSKVSVNNTVNPNDSLDKLFGKFRNFDKPTALLVGDWESGEFELSGIISYIDVFKKFRDFLQENRTK